MLSFLRKTQSCSKNIKYGVRIFLTILSKLLIKPPNPVESVILISLT